MGGNSSKEVEKYKVDKEYDIRAKEEENRHEEKMLETTIRGRINMWDTHVDRCEKIGYSKSDALKKSKHIIDDTLKQLEGASNRQFAFSDGSSETEIIENQRDILDGLLKKLDPKFPGGKK
uniref:uncharacterized protein LOC120333229 n=1 Tax=Styela clava TaxID=7725 RepID=UPI001939EA0A|nr:uncharacterized protein LOC120333229 [Styela clava]